MPGQETKNWIQLHVDTHADAVAQVSRCLEAIGALAVTMIDLADTPIYEPPLDPPLGKVPLWPDTRVSGLYATGHGNADQLIKQLQNSLQGLESIRIHSEYLADQDWQRAWVQDFKPMQFGTHLWVCPDNQAPPAAQANTIFLDPGLAFGSGTHPTTSLCLEWLDGQALEGSHVIDYGCGSGILAIAAARLGAQQVWAVDIDPQALYATRNNAQKNHVEDRISTHRPEELPAVQADILMANILANPLIDLAATFAHSLLPGGLLVLSGILEEQTDTVWQAYQDNFQRDYHQTRGDWACLLGRKR